MTAMKDLSEARRIVEQQRGEIERLQQEVTMLRQEYAADTVEIAKLSAMIDEQRQDLSDARSGWERSAESLREADEAMEKLQSELADMRAIHSIDERFGGRIAFMLECMILDSQWYWDAACQLLEEYKAEWEKVNPSPPTFMGEPMPPERKARLLEMKEKRNEQEQSE